MWVGYGVKSIKSSCSAPKSSTEFNLPDPNARVALHTLAGNPFKGAVKSLRRNWPKVSIYENIPTPQYFEAAFDQLILKLAPSLCPHIP